MAHSHRRRFLVCAIATISVSGFAFGFRSPDLEPTLLTVDASISAVTAYRGRAAVTRTATLDLNPGVYELRIGNLPESVLPESFQARAQGAVNVVGVDYSPEQTTTPPKQFAELDEKIESLQKQLKEIGEQRELIKLQENFIDSLNAKAASEAAKESGTAQLNIDAMSKQLTFMADQRGKLLTARRELDAKQRDAEKQLAAAQANRNALAGNSMVNRSALVSVVATDQGPVTLQLTYLVANATWEPTYSIRAAMDGSSAQIEYDAMLTQRTGEDWNDVSLTLSTAQPTIAANPPALEPWFVDIVRPMEKDGLVSDRAGRASRASKEPEAPAAMLRHADASVLTAELKSLAADAEVLGGGPSVSYQLPRKVTIKSNIEKQQRTRIATINTNPQFVHVATPMLTDSVYIRGDLINTSAYQLLPGRASIFVGQDYVGPTTLQAVAPSGEFKLHFGIDQSVKATRQLVTKKTENTGLLGGGRRTVYDYRIIIDNGSGKSIMLELWDRQPISRAEEIQIDLVDLSHPLATDAKYLAEQHPQGLLKWGLSIAPTAAGKNAAAVTYGVRVNRAKDVEMTGLPE